MSEEKLQRAQRKHTRQLQRQLFQLWDKYVAAEITASQLLRKCSNIYSPPTISVLDKDLSAYSVLIDFDIDFHVKLTFFAKCHDCWVNNFCIEV